jgi:hypothetical protein
MWVLATLTKEGFSYAAYPQIIKPPKILLLYLNECLSYKVEINFIIDPSSYTALIRLCVV